jgi:hypothetical protein
MLLLTNLWRKYLGGRKNKAETGRRIKGRIEAQADHNSVFEAELQDVIPICHATIAGTRIIGRLTAGYVYTILYRSRRVLDIFGRRQC